MLHYPTIDESTLDLLKKLQAAPEFFDLRLVGGTALALQIGHRKSIDLDLFGTLTADSISISKRVDEIGETTILQQSDNIKIFSVNDIKVDIVNYHYPWIEEALDEDGLILAGKKDIAAMKLAAVTNRGTKKDFVDLYFLLRVFKLNQLLDFYQRKYRDGSVFLVLKSLSYFEDAENEAPPVMLEPVEWNEVKAAICDAVRKYA